MTNEEYGGKSMKRFKFVLVVIIAIMALTACGSDNKKDTEEKTLEDLKVEFNLLQTAEVGQTVPLEANVTSNGDPITDAEEMTFEYWNVNDEENTTNVESTNQEDGTYTAEVIFNEPGTYEIYAHTTAGGLHTMPKKSITITGEKSAHSEDEAAHDHSHEATNSEDGHTPSADVSIQFDKINEAKLKEETSLTVDVELGNEPLTDATVLFELIDPDENHELLETDQVQEGTYPLNILFRVMETIRLSFIFQMMKDYMNMRNTK